MNVGYFAGSVIGQRGFAGIAKVADLDVAAMAGIGQLGGSVAGAMVGVMVANDLWNRTVGQSNRNAALTKENAAIARTADELAAKLEDRGAAGGRSVPQNKAPRLARRDGTAGRDGPGDSKVTRHERGNR